MTDKIRYKKLIPIMVRLYRRLKVRYESGESFFHVATTEEYDKMFKNNKTDEFWGGIGPDMSVDEDIIDYQEIIDEVSDKLFYVMSPMTSKKKFVVRLCTDCMNHAEMAMADDDMYFILANDEEGMIEFLDDFFTECKNKLN